jgi:hypothetical protein
MKPQIMLTTFGTILIFLLLAQVSIVAPAHALTRYYNCIARVANKNATLAISNVDACYNLIFKGALNYYGIKQHLKAASHDNSTNPEEKPGRDSRDYSPHSKQLDKIDGNSNNQNVFG